VTPDLQRERVRERERDRQTRRLAMKGRRRGYEAVADHVLGEYMRDLSRD